MKTLLWTFFALAALLVPVIAVASVNMDNTTNARIDFGKSTALDSTTGLSISTWIYFRSYGANNIARILNDGVDGSTGYAFYLNNSGSNTDGLAFLSGADASAYFDNNILATSTWECVGVTFNAASKAVDFYLNGTLKGTSNAVNNLNASGADIWVGNSSSNTSRQFDGFISDLKVWSRTLSTQEMRSNCSNFYPVSTQGLSFWAPLFGTGPVERDFGPARLVGTTTAAEAPIKNVTSRAPPIYNAW